MGKKREHGQQRVGAIVLSGLMFIGGLIGDYGWATTQASAQTTPTTLNTIVQKEDQILGAINALPTPSPPTDLSGVTQSWNKVLPAAQRFVVLAAFANAAVLDKETGLVWEQSPTTALMGWSTARIHCSQLGTGGRKGWRLPSVHELASLIDPSVVPPAGPTLPPGHPFANIQTSGVSYWAASTNADNPSDAWSVYFFNGSVGTVGYKNANDGVWCVRGGNNADAY